MQRVNCVSKSEGDCVAPFISFGSRIWTLTVESERQAVPLFIDAEDSDNLANAWFVGAEITPGTPQRMPKRLQV